MSIAHMSYVLCDECGNPGPLGDGSKEARMLAGRSGWVMRVSYDLCPFCVERINRVQEPEEVK